MCSRLAYWLSRALGATVVLAVVIVAVALGDHVDARNAMEFVRVGHPDNAGEQSRLPGDETYYGSVGYVFDMGMYHVTNAQYVQFLNAVDRDGSNPNGIYNASMAGNFGGIAFNSGAGAGAKYAVRTVSEVSRGDRPVNFVSWYDAARYTNWLTTGDTERGAYTFTGPTAVAAILDHATAVSTLNQWIAAAGSGYDDLTPVSSVVFLPNEQEWYKAAYYDPTLAGGTGGYYLYGTGKNQITGTEANYSDSGFGRPTAVGTREVGSHLASPYGAYDMAGNVFDWVETPIGDQFGRRGGSFYHAASILSASTRLSFAPATEAESLGFRVASIPEPGGAAMLLAGAVSLLLRRRRRDTRSGCPILYQGP